MPPRARTATALHWEALVRRIAARRLRAGDTRADEIPDNPTGVLAYLRKHPNPLTRTLGEDVDALGLIEATRDLLDGLEYAILDRNLDEPGGLTAERLGAAYGMTSRQGARDRRDRLWSARHNPDGRRDEKYARQHRAELRAAQKTADKLAVARERWLHRHYDETAQLAAVLLEHRHLLDHDDDASGWLDEVAADHRRTVVSHTAWVVLGLAVDAYTALPGPPAPVRAAVDQYRALASQYATETQRRATG